MTNEAQFQRHVIASSSMTTTRVTIIEDNLMIRENVVRFLGYHEEFQVTESFGSVEAFLYKLKMDPSYKVDVLLLDIGLPGMSGLEALPIFREKLPDMDIIMLSAYEDEARILKALCSGACSYISKKANVEEIVDAIRIVVGGGSYMSPSVAREIVQHFMGGRTDKSNLLTPRQHEILQMLVDGKNTVVIAKELFLSVETVRSHIKTMYRSLEVNNKAEAIVKYMKGEI